MNFTNLLAALDGAVSDHLCDDALYTNGDGAALPVRIMFDLPVSADRLGSVAFTRSRPTIRVLRSVCPGLARGDLFRRGADIWAAAEAPTAEDDGAWWVVEVEPG